jgi:hypothetical protein
MRYSIHRRRPFPRNWLAMESEVARLRWRLYEARSTQQPKQGGNSNIRRCSRHVNGESACSETPFHKEARWYKSGPAGMREWVLSV